MFNKKYGKGFLVMLAIILWCCTARQVKDVPETSSTETEAQATSDPAILPSPETYRYTLEELGIDLVIPKNINVYRIDGVYQDWTGDINIHQFSQWIVLTCKKYEESELAQALKDNYSEEAKNIVFAVSISDKELYPVNCLCYGVFPKAKVRLIDEGYCEILYCGDVKSSDSTLLSAYEWAGEEAVANAEEWKPWIDQWREAIIESTLPVVDMSVTPNQFISPDGVSEGTEGYQDTIVSDEVWDRYRKVEEELSESPERYAYNEAVEDFLIKEVNLLIGQRREFIQYLKENRVVSVYMDETQDSYIRAYYYMLWQKNAEEFDKEEVSMDDVLVVLQEWENGQQSFLIYRKEADRSYREITGGYNYFTDLQVTRDYIDKFNRSLIEAEPKAVYEYPIGELGIDLEIPASLFVYRIDGLYLDDQLRIIPLDFVDWVIVTDKEYSEEYLKNELIDHIHEEIKHVVFGVELPVEELTADPSRHHYDPQTILSLMESVEEHVELYEKMSVVTENDGEIVSTYADEAVDVCLRAYFYANEVALAEANGKDTTALSIDDVIAILQDWNNGQKTCYGYVRTDGMGEYESVYRGGQAYMMDLTAAYQYMVSIAALASIYSPRI